MDLYKCNVQNLTIVKNGDMCPDSIRCPECKNHNIYKISVPSLGSDY